MQSMKQDYIKLPQAFHEIAIFYTSLQYDHVIELHQSF